MRTLILMAISYKPLGTGEPACIQQATCFRADRPKGHTLLFENNEPAADNPTGTAILTASCRKNMKNIPVFTFLFPLQYSPVPIRHA